MLIVCSQSTNKNELAPRMCVSYTSYHYIYGTYNTCIYIYMKNTHSILTQWHDNIILVYGLTTRRQWQAAGSLLSIRLWSKGIACRRWSIAAACISEILSRFTVACWSTISCMHWAVNETARIQATMLNMQLNHEFFFFFCGWGEFFFMLFCSFILSFCSLPPCVPSACCLEPSIIWFNW